MVVLDYKTLGKRIREERIKQNLTQGKLAEEVFLSTTYIGQIERGERHITIDKLILIAKRLNITIDYLLRDSLEEHETITADVWNGLMYGRSDSEKSMALDTVKLIFRYLDERK